MKKFGLTGVAGYIAPRHLKAIKETGNELIASVDPHDSVGILDQYFPNTSFFIEIERFERHIDKLRRSGNGIDFLTICSPNNLHDAHIRLALRNEADAICEKPLVLNPWNLDLLDKLGKEYQQKIYTILQLRVHPALMKLKEEIEREKVKRKTKYKVGLSYITSRGLWYDYSWKGDVHKSGGVVTNIGIHFFDLLIWLFGKPVNSKVLNNEANKCNGELELTYADVKWNLSIDKLDLPANIISEGKKTFRSITIDGAEVEFSDGFTDLHTKVYKEILAGCGFGIEDARDSIELVYQIRNYKS